ncbi:MAG: thiamine pyrophosphate-dependent dehydrogenase E1 component subunit alpha [Kiritimatiellae bacterium]|nr:thiamine pyrophosphate-dependent dehydrogenase E1 component subunit alpha [Kiritimatiellia bacterium]
MAARKKHDLQGEEKTRWVSLLNCMLLARKTEERLVRLYHQGRIFGGVYTGIGQEAIGAATALAGGQDDLFAPLIRDMTVHIGRGESVLNIFRQYLGRATGPTRGRDGNVHYGNMDNGVFAMISHLGAMLPVIVGGVMARRRLGRDTIGVAYFGDGASSTGDVHEALNFAAVFDVPVIFLVENNHYAYSTPTPAQYRCKHLKDRAVGYGMEGILADGNDAIELFFLTRDLIASMREKPRPILLECDTMRMRGHGEHDDFGYVPRELIEKYTRRDPILLVRERLVKDGALAEDEIAALEQACQEEVDAAYHQALAEPVPSPDTLMEGVYAEG